MTIARGACRLPGPLRSAATTHCTEQSSHGTRALKSLRAGGAASGSQRPVRPSAPAAVRALLWALSTARRGHRVLHRVFQGRSSPSAMTKPFSACVSVTLDARRELRGTAGARWLSAPLGRAPVSSLFLKPCCTQVGSRAQRYRLHTTHPCTTPVGCFAEIQQPVNSCSHEINKDKSVPVPRSQLLVQEGDPEMQNQTRAPD